MKRSLKIVALVLISILLATGVLVRFASPWILRRVINIVGTRTGMTIQIDQIRGSIRSPVELRNILVITPSHDTIVAAERVAFGYRLMDLIVGNVELSFLEVDSPRIAIDVPQPSGEEPAADRRAIVVRNAEMSNGVAAIGVSPLNGDPKTYRATGVRLQLDEFRLGASGNELSVDITGMGGILADPRVVLNDLVGSVRLAGDTLWLDLQGVQLANASLGLEGWLTEPGSSSRQSSLVAEFRNVTPEDVPYAVEELTGVPYRVSGRVRLTEDGSGRSMIVAESLRVRVDGDAADVFLEADVAIGPDGSWALEDGLVVAEELATRYAASFVDTSIVTGMINGRVTARGDRDSLQFDAHLTYVDDRDLARSSVAATGRIDGGTSSDFVFDRVAIRALQIDMRTANRFAGRIPDVGWIRASGVVNGPRRIPAFRGTVLHGGTPWGLSEINGEIRGLEFANLRLDSIQPELISAMAPTFKVANALTGRAEISRSADSTVVDVDLRSNVGTVELRARGPTRSDGIDLSGFIALSSVNIAIIDSQLPHSSLNGNGEGNVVMVGGVLRDWSLQFAMDTSTIDQITVDAMTFVGRGDSAAMTIDALDVASDVLEGTANGSLSLTETPFGRIEFAVRTDSLAAVSSAASRWIPVALSELNGSMLAAGTVEGTLRDYQFRATVAASRIGLRGVSATQSTAELSWQSNTSSIGLNGRIDSISLGSVTVADVEMATGGTVDSLAWLVGGNQLGAGRWTLRGDARMQDSARTIRLDSATVPLGTRSWRLIRPALITLGDSAFDVTDLVLAAPNGTAQIQLDGGMSSRAMGRFTGTVTNVQLQDLARLLGRDSAQFGGGLNGSFEIVGSAQSPEVNAAFTMDNVRARLMRIRDAQAEVTYRSGEFAGRIEMVGDTSQLAQVDFSLPVDLRLVPFAFDRLDAPLVGQLRVNAAPLSLISPLFPTWQNPQGYLQADARLNGTWSNPRLDGLLSIEQGSVFISDLGVQLRELEARIGLTDDTVNVERFEVRSGDGEVRASGYLGLGDLQNPIFSLQVDATRFPAIDLRDYMTMVVTGRMSLAGSLNEPRLTGTGTAVRGSVSFADILQKQIVDLDDPLFSPYVDTTLLRAEGLSSTVVSQLIKRLRIDSLRVVLGDDFWMRSGEGDVQLSGNLTVNKLADAYSLDGTLNAERGSYRLQLAPGVTREFTVTRGVVQYFGTPDLDADLDIDARHTVRTFGDTPVNIFAHLGGTLYGPTVTLTSDIRPPVSDGELISYLLFGSPTVQAFAGEGGTQSRVFREFADQFALALSGQAQTFVRGLGIPLDYLQIRPGDVDHGLSGTQIAIGKRFSLLGRPAFLTASPRVCPRHSFFSTENIGASLEARLTGRFSLSGSVDPVRVCETATASISTRYQLGVDLLWENRRY